MTGHVPHRRDVGADLCVVDALARAALVARRHGLTVRVRCDDPSLHRLMQLCGLDEVLLADDTPGAGQGGADVPGSEQSGSAVERPHGQGESRA